MITKNAYINAFRKDVMCSNIMSAGTKTLNLSFKMKCNRNFLFDEKSKSTRFIRKREQDNSRPMEIFLHVSAPLSM